MAMLISTFFWAFNNRLHDTGLFIHYGLPGSTFLILHWEKYVHKYSLDTVKFHVIAWAHLYCSISSIKIPYSLNNQPLFRHLKVSKLDWLEKVVPFYSKHGVWHFTKFLFPTWDPHHITRHLPGQFLPITPKAALRIFATAPASHSIPFPTSFFQQYKGLFQARKNKTNTLVILSNSSVVTIRVSPREGRK